MLATTAVTKVVGDRVAAQAAVVDLDLEVFVRRREVGPAAAPKLMMMMMRPPARMTRMMMEKGRQVKTKKAESPKAAATMTRRLGPGRLAMESM